MDSFGDERNITNNKNNLTVMEMPSTIGLFDVWKLLTQTVDTNSSLEQLPDLKEKIKINAVNKLMVIKNKDSSNINIYIYFGDHIYNFIFTSNWNQEDMLKIVNSLKIV
jgi:predicted nucleotidyltransferase component of viral defense system